MIRTLRILFSVAAVVGVAGVVINVLQRDWMDVVLTSGLVLLYGALAANPGLLSRDGEETSTGAASMGLQLAVVLLFLYLLLSLI